MSWCTPPDLAWPEWALNETVVEGTAATLKLQADGSLLWISPDGKDRTSADALPPGDRVYLDGYVATQAHFLEGLRHGTDTRPGSRSIEDDGRRLGGLPLGRGRKNGRDKNGLGRGCASGFWHSIG